MGNVRVVDAAQQAATNAVTALLNNGGAGSIDFYDGVQPADPDDSIGMAVLLGTLTWSADAFGDAAITGTATANIITEDISADATGVATWARSKDGAGNTVFDCDVGEDGDDATITIDDKNIIENGGINITSFTLTTPNGA